MKRILATLLLLVTFAPPGATSEAEELVQSGDEAEELRQALGPVYRALDNALRLDLVSEDDFDIMRNSLDDLGNLLQAEYENQSAPVLLATARVRENAREILDSLAFRMEKLVAFLRGESAEDGLLDNSTYQSTVESCGAQLGEAMKDFADALESLQFDRGLVIPTVQETGDCAEYVLVLLREIDDAKRALEDEMQYLVALQVREECDKNHQTPVCKDISDRIRRARERRQELEPPRSREGCGFLGLGCLLKLVFGIVTWPMAVVLDPVSDGESLDSWKKTFMGDHRPAVTRDVAGDERSYRVLGPEHEQELPPQVISNLIGSGREEVPYNNGGTGRVVNIFRTADAMELYHGNVLVAVFRDSNVDMMNDDNGMSFRFLLEMDVIRFSGDIYDGTTFVSEGGETIRVRRLRLSGEASGGVRFTITEPEVGSERYQITFD